jgi:hypothetical protein
MSDITNNDLKLPTKDTKHCLKQTFLTFKVHVSMPVTDESQRATWPGKEPARLQLRMDRFLGQGTPTAPDPDGQGSESKAD